MFFFNKYLIYFKHYNIKNKKYLYLDILKKNFQNIKKKSGFFFFKSPSPDFFGYLKELLNNSVLKIRFFTKYFLHLDTL